MGLPCVHGSSPVFITNLFPVGIWVWHSMCYFCCSVWLPHFFPGTYSGHFSSLDIWHLSLSVSQNLQVNSSHPTQAALDTSHQPDVAGTAGFYCPTNISSSLFFFLLKKNNNTKNFREWITVVSSYLWKSHFILPGIGLGMGMWLGYGQWHLRRSLLGVSEKYFLPH